MTQNRNFYLYAIRCKKTNLYLPQIEYECGYTNYEPEELGGKLGPRFFRTKRAAELALKRWLKGRHERPFHRNYDFSNCPDGYDKIKIVPVSSRKVEEMEIVEFSLIET